MGDFLIGPEGKGTLRQTDVVFAVIIEKWKWYIRFQQFTNPGLSNEK